MMKRAKQPEREVDIKAIIKLAYKSSVEDLKMFFSETGKPLLLGEEMDWTKAEIAAAKEWRSVVGEKVDEKDFIDFYRNSEYYVYAMATYSATSKKQRLGQKILKVLRTLDVETIVDFGCGAGSDTIFLGKCGYKVFPMDVESTSLDFARYRFKKYNLYTEEPIVIPGKIPQCGLVMSLDVLEHVFDPFSTIECLLHNEPKFLLLTTAFNVHDEERGGTPYHTDHSVHKVEKHIKELGYTKIKLSMPFPPRLFERRVE